MYRYKMGLINWINQRKFFVMENQEYNELNDSKKALEKIETAVRPYTDEILLDGAPRLQGKGHRFGYYSRYGLNINDYDLFLLSRVSDLLQLIFNTKTGETFRNGYDIESSTDEENKPEKTDIDKWLARANNNRQSMTEVLSEFDKDLDTFDRGYILALKDYWVTNGDEIVGGDIKEFIRINPLTVQPMLDKTERLGYDYDSSEKIYFSLKNRMEHTEDPVDPITGLPNLRAHYLIYSEEGDMYFTADELFAKSVWNPSKSGGFSPLYSGYNKVRTLVAMDDYIRREYDNERPSKKIPIFKSANIASLQSAFKELKAKLMANPHSMRALFHQVSDPSKQIVELLDFTKPLEEVQSQFLELRKEYRQSIGALYGVSPIFQNDNSTSGGLNNEGLQITVTNRVVQKRQTVYDEEVFPFIFNVNLGIHTYKIKLNPSEEKDQAKDMELKAIELANAKAAAELGLKVKFTSDGDFVISEGQVELQVQTAPAFDPFSNSNTFDVNSQKTKNIKKAAPPVGRVQAIKFKTNLEKELENIFKKLDLRKKPSEKQLIKIVDKATKNLDKRLKVKASNVIKAVYRDGQKVMQKELNKNLSITDKDKNVIEALKRDPTRQEAFENMSKDISKDLTSMIKTSFSAPGGITIDKLVKQAQGVLDVSDTKLKEIMRTETSKIFSAARKSSYQKEGNFDAMKFKWIGPNDNRTSDISKIIKNKTIKGVSYDDLIKIIKSEVKKTNPKWKVNEQSPLTHPNNRHTYVRIVDV